MRSWTLIITMFLIPSSLWASDCGETTEDAHKIYQEAQNQETREDLTERTFAAAERKNMDIEGAEVLFTYNNYGYVYSAYLKTKTEICELVEGRREVFRWRMNFLQSIPAPERDGLRCKALPKK